MALRLPARATARVRPYKPNGDTWEVWLVIYDTDNYVPGGKDEVLQYKKNGREVGHYTRHLAQDDRFIHENYHGITSVPGDARRV